MLSELEIENQELDSNGFNLTPYCHSKEVNDAFIKILECIETDRDILSDGEVIDMIHNYLHKIGVSR